ncbi:MAG: uracil-DNA glycosylase [Planctomycetota bacterium]
MSEAEAAATWVRAHLAGLALWGIRHVVHAGNGSAYATQAPMAVGRSDSQVASEPARDVVQPPGGSRVPDVAPRALHADKARVLAEEAEQVAGCSKCRLAATRTKTVYGVGDPHARLMFVGEAPGHDEDQRGEPFVGKAGELLDRIIGALGIERRDVYIANVLKCRPPENRDPLPDEVACCAPFLHRQIECVAPAMIVALGRPAANFLLESTAPVGELRGRRHSYRGIPVVATYHPAYLLRNPDAKKLVWQDLQVVIQELGLPGPPRRE